MKKLKCNWRLFALGLISIIAGILFCAIPTDKLIKITFYVIGALVIVNGCISLYHSIKAKDKLSILFDIVDIAFGICLIFFHQTFMLIHYRRLSNCPSNCQNYFKSNAFSSVLS